MKRYLLTLGMMVLAHGSPEINVQGTATIPNYSNAPSGNPANTGNGTDFGSVDVGASKLHFFRVQNTGNMTLTYSAQPNSSPNFTVSGLDSPLGNGDAT